MGGRGVVGREGRRDVRPDRGRRRMFCTGWTMLAGRNIMGCMLRRLGCSYCRPRTRSRSSLTVAAALTGTEQTMDIRGALPRCTPCLRGGVGSHQATLHERCLAILWAGMVGVGRSTVHGGDGTCFRFVVFKRRRCWQNTQDKFASMLHQHSNTRPPSRTRTRLLLSALRLRSRLTMRIDPA